VGRSDLGRENQSYIFCVRCYTCLCHFETHGRAQALSHEFHLQKSSFAKATPQYIIPYLGAQVKLPLGQHPRNRRGGHDQRAQKASLQGSVAEDKFTDEVCQRNAVGPDSEIVCDRRVNVVGGGHANHGGEESPGAKNATRQGLNRYDAIGVELGSVVGGAVGLQTVDG